MGQNNLQNDSTDRRVLLVPTTMASRAKSLALTLTETVADTRDYVRTEEFRWRALITTGRYATHSMILLAGVASILLASFKLNTAAPKEAVAAPATRTAHSAQAGLAGLGSISVAGIQTVSLNHPGRGGSSGGQTLFTLDQPDSAHPGAVGTTVAQGLSPYTGVSNVDSGLLSKHIALTEEKAAPARVEIQSYTVQSGDTIEGIANRFNLQPTTLIWSNDAVEKSPDRFLQVGQILKILPFNGIFYTVQTNDSLNGIADKFKASVNDIVTSPLNTLQPDTPLQPGMQIVIPNGIKEWQQQQIVVQGNSNTAAPRVGTTYVAPVAPSYSAPGNFGWPTAASAISQGFWWGHRALDIAAAIGVPIYASESGYVNYAGWNNTGYGNMLLLSHGGGFETLYGHLSEWYVDPGQYVTKGQLIAAMGSSGNSTGPHLHFEIRVNGVPSNPYFYLQ